VRRAAEHGHGCCVAPGGYGAGEADFDEINARNMDARIERRARA
jgi:hypothetical protein